MNIARQLPLLLTSLRALLAPVLVLLALYDPDPRAFGICLVLGFLSDIFDGVIARRLGIATPTLRRLDSVADTLFYVAATYAVWHLDRQVIVAHVRAFLLLGALELARYLFDLAKFGREASYHMWSSKLWGLALFLAFFAVLVFSYGGRLVAIPLYLGILADLEGLAISLTLREWRSDVPSIVHAWKARARSVT